MNDSQHNYFHGPTTCIAHPEVVRSIENEIKQSHALSGGDIRLATAMGLLSTDAVQPFGFNDGIFYPVNESVARSPLVGSVHPAALVRLPSDPTPIQPRTMHALALLVDFNDNPGSRPKAEFETLLFDTNNPDSMANRYTELSGGRLNLTGTVTDYIRAPQPYSFYTAGKSGMDMNFPNNTPGLLVDVLTAFCQHNSLQPFDQDGDGYVDGVFLIHAGGGAEAEQDIAKRKDKIWSHKWTLPAPFDNNGVKVFAYSTEPEDGKVGVFAHEFGHVLGLPDLYDSTYRSGGVGNWCLMSGGSWGGGGNQPVRMSAWCLSRLGWVTPKRITKNTHLTLSPLDQDENACFQVWKKGKKGPEYFLLENRQRIGRDAALPGSGLAVWHVDETQTNNNNPLSYKVGLVQADGRRDLEFNRNGGDKSDLFPGSKKIKRCDDSTTPSTRANDGSPTNVEFFNISESGGAVQVEIKL